MYPIGRRFETEIATPSALNFKKASMLVAAVKVVPIFLPLLSSQGSVRISVHTVGILASMTPFSSVTVWSCFSGATPVAGTGAVSGAVACGTDVGVAAGASVVVAASGALSV